MRTYRTRPVLLSPRNFNKPGAKISDPARLQHAGSDTLAKTSPLLSVLAGLFIACFFLFFTWRGLLVYYTGDDLFNLYSYWSKPVSALVKGNIFFWTPYYRPFGGIIYRSLFAIFGFNPYPMYVVFYAAMLVNLWLAYLVFKRIGGSREIGAMATLLYAFHGKFDYLYYNAGSMYDVFCFLFFFSALLIYLRARLQGRFLGVGGTLGFLACLVCALNSKEMGATLPVIVLVYELIFHPPDFRSLRALIRWCFREGRMALLGGLCVLIYLPAKLGAAGFGSRCRIYSPLYLGALARRHRDVSGGVALSQQSGGGFGVAPLTLLGVAGFYAAAHRHRALDAVPRAVVRTARFSLLRCCRYRSSQLAWASCFICRWPAWRSTPRFAWCVSKKVCAGFSRKRLAPVGRPGIRRRQCPPRSRYFLATALVMAVVDYRNWPRAPDPRFSPYKNTVAEFSRLYPRLPHGSKLLFRPQCLG